MKHNSPVPVETARALELRAAVVWLRDRVQDFTAPPDGIPVLDDCIAHELDDGIEFDDVYDDDETFDEPTPEDELTGTTMDLYDALTFLSAALVPGCDYDTLAEEPLACVAALAPVDLPTTPSDIWWNVLVYAWHLLDEAYQSPAIVREQRVYDTSNQLEQWLTALFPED